MAISDGGCVVGNDECWSSLGADSSGDLSSLPSAVIPLGCEGGNDKSSVLSRHGSVVSSSHDGWVFCGGPPSLLPVVSSPFGGWVFCNDPPSLLPRFRSASCLSSLLSCEDEKKKAEYSRTS